MSVSELIARLARKAKIAKIDRCDYARYRELMQSILDNSNEVDAEEAETLLESMGKTFEDLRKDAEVFARRVAWSAERDAAIKAEPQLRSVEQKIEGLNQVKQQFLDEHNRKMQSLATERSQLAFTVGQLSTAGQGLRQNILDPKLIHERDELIKESIELANREDALVQQIGPGNNTTLTALEFAKANLQVAKSDLARAAGQSLIEHCKKKADECAGYVRTLEGNLKRLDDELQQVRSKMQQIRIKQSDLDRRCLEP
jgi:outer membrane murein-binding lipoprotein Lpp